MRHRPKTIRLTLVLALFILASCDTSSKSDGTAEKMGEVFELSGFLDNPVLNEVSGIESSRSGVFFVHNDEGKPLLHVIDREGRYRGKIKIDGGKNRDWEDIASLPRPEGQLLVLGDIGDNHIRYKSIRLYFVLEPLPDSNGLYPRTLELKHQLKVRYPDGPKDCEAMAFDPASETLLFMTKRDKVPRLYGLPVETALTRDEAKLEFLGEIPTLSPPTATELLRSGKKAFWLSQPTGLDISDDGKRAAVITYRSLYLYTREDGESWAEAFQRKPAEFIGPPGVYEEAVTFGADQAVYVTTEKIPTPLYRLIEP